MKNLILITLAILLFTTCFKEDLPHVSNTTTNIEADSIVFAVIGDYGREGDPAFMVSELVKSWSPDFIVTLGDNNYESGNLSTIQQNIAQYYDDYIYNPDAPSGYKCNGMAAAAEQNRFFPSLGNHDQNNANYSQPFLTYFTLPGKETYYSFKWGPVEFFTLNSGRNGEAACCDSEQAVWLEGALAKSEAPFKIVYFHHPPYSTSKHGNTDNMQWPYKAWGASVVLSGHSHLYERITKVEDPDFYYLVNGMGGAQNLYDCGTNPLNYDQFNYFCYNQVHGAMKVEANVEQLKISFINIENPSNPIDEIIIR